MAVVALGWPELFLEWDQGYAAAARRLRFAQWAISAEETITRGMRRGIVSLQNRTWLMLVRPISHLSCGAVNVTIVRRKVQHLNVAETCSRYHSYGKSCSGCYFKHEAPSCERFASIYICFRLPRAFPGFDDRLSTSRMQNLLPHITVHSSTRPE
jgi:hypothetical protein